MKKNLFIIVTAFMMQVFNAQTDSFGQTPPGNIPGLAEDVTGPYFGQTPPGTTPQLFAPEILTQPGIVTAMTRIAFSPDGNECYFSGSLDAGGGARMFYKKRVNNVWTPTVLAPFFPDSPCRQPSFSAGGDTLYFTSNQNGNSDIWMVVRTSQGWGTPQVFPAPINTSSYEGMYTQTTDGTAYIESDRPGGHGGYDVWRINPQQPGQPLEIQDLGAPINTSGGENDPFVSSDGRYLIFSSGYSDLFVTFNKGNGGWTAPLNLNQFCPGINTGNEEYAPFISSDRRYLFFNRNGVGIFWVSISCIDSLRNINFPPYVKNPIPNQTAIKDSLFNYQVSDSTFFDDDGNNTLTYSATLYNGKPLPGWLLFDPAARAFSGTPVVVTTLTIKITATDTANARASGTFKITVTNPSSVEDGIGQLPKELMLLQNYPNPFNPTTTIHYSVAKPIRAQLGIYNLLGQKIKTLVDSYQNAGEHSIVWDATDDKNNPVGSGIYLYSLTSKEITIQKKMFLIR
jgi:hypothetical protein